MKTIEIEKSEQTAKKIELIQESFEYMDTHGIKMIRQIHRGDEKYQCISISDVRTPQFDDYYTRRATILSDKYYLGGLDKLSNNDDDDELIYKIYCSPLKYQAENCAFVNFRNLEIEESEPVPHDSIIRLLTKDSAGADVGLPYSMWLEAPYRIVDWPINY